MKAYEESQQANYFHGGDHRGMAASHDV